MRAAIYQNQEIVPAEVPAPEPGPGEVLAKTLACGICGSDLHAFHNSKEHPGETAGVGQTTGTKLEAGTVMGHEFCAEILDYGPGTQKRFKIGTRVCSTPILARPGGAQFIGYSKANPGGYGEFVRLTERLLVEVPNGLATERAALTEPMSVGAHAVNKAGLGKDDVPLVIGCGPIGLAVIAALKLKGAHPIVAADYSPGRRQLAQAMGADVLVDPREKSPFASWKEMAQTGLPDPGPNLPGWLVGSGLKPAVIFECVGAPGMIDALMAAAPQDARIVIVGLCFAQDRFYPMSGISKELNLIFSNSFTLAEYEQTLRNIGEGKLDVGPLITGKTGLSGVMQAFRDLEQAGTHAKILIEPWRD